MPSTRVILYLSIEKETVVLRETTSVKRPSWAVSLVLVVTALTTIATSEQDLPIIDANRQVGVSSALRISLDLGQGGSNG